MNGLPSWSFAGMRRRRRGREGWGNKITEGGGVQDMDRENQAYRERPVWVGVSLCWDQTPTVQEVN